MQQAVAKKWEFELFVIDQTRRSVFAQANLRALCKEYLKGNYHIKILDIAKHPELASKNKIFVSPTLIVRSPLPERTLVGDLSDTNKVLECLDLARPRKTDTGKANREYLKKEYFKMRPERRPQ